MKVVVEGQTKRDQIFSLSPDKNPHKPTQQIATMSISLIQHTDVEQWRASSELVSIGGMKFLCMVPATLVQIGGTENLNVSEYGAQQKQTQGAENKYDIIMNLRDDAAQKVADMEEFARKAVAKNDAAKEYAKSLKLPLTMVPMLKMGNRVKVVLDKSEGATQLLEIDDDGTRRKGAAIEVFNPGCKSFVVVQINGVFLKPTEEAVCYGISLKAKYAAAKKYDGEYVPQGVDFDDLVLADEA